MITLKHYLTIHCPCYVAKIPRKMPMLRETQMFKKISGGQRENNVSHYLWKNNATNVERMKKRKESLENYSKIRSPFHLVSYFTLVVQTKIIGI